MSGIDQILEHIGNEAEENAKRILDSAAVEADRIRAAEKEEAERLEKQISKQSELDVAAASKRVQSAAELKEKRMILEAKQKEIDSVLSAATEKLCGLEEKEYFEVLEKMIQRYSTGQSGEIKFSEKDLGRMPAAFKKTIAASGLTLSDEAVSINGGFILDYGEIEENCSFEALIHASKEALQDKIGQILFN